MRNREDNFRELMETAASMVIPSYDHDEPEFMKKYADVKDTCSSSTSDTSVNLASMTHDVIGKKLT